MRKLIKNKKGFTLTESIVVLVIIAVLAAMAIPTYIGFVEDARAKTIVTEARAAYVAAGAYALEQIATGTTTDTSKLVARIEGSKDSSDSEITGAPVAPNNASHVLNAYLKDDVTGKLSDVTVTSTGKISALTYTNAAGTYKVTFSGANATFAKVSS